MKTTTTNPMKVLLLLSMLVSLLNGCSQPNGSTGKEPEASNNAQAAAAVSELTPEQQSAFDALNTLQVNTDQRNRLYSTFAGGDHPCYPPDTSLTISQPALLTAMKLFVEKNCKNLSAEERDKLAAASVLAQEAYTVALCLDESAKLPYDKGVPMTGTWVLTNVLGKRDVLIVW